MITLSAPGVTAVIDPDRGGRLTSLRVCDREVIGSAAVEDGDDPSFYDGAFPLAPYAGRVADGAVDIAGRRVALPRSHRAGHSDHGLVHNLAWSVATQTESTAELRTSSSLHPWPADSTATVYWEVSECGLRARLEWASPMPAPIVLGFHPWFRAVVGGATATVEIAAPQWVVNDLVVAEQPSAPRDAVAHGVVKDPAVRWPGVLTLRSSSNASTWIVCETFDGAVCLEPLTDIPASIARQHSTLKAQTLHWALTIEPG